MKTFDKVSLIQKFQELKTRSIPEVGFNAVAISDDCSHRLGISPEGYPIFFIECSSSKRITDINLNLFKVLFNRQCSISDNESSSKIDGVFSIIQLNSLNPDFQKYFLEVVYLLLRRLDDKPSISVLKSEVSKLLSIFTSIKAISKEIVRGLWAELMVIKQSSNPSYLIRSWHVVPEDKFDFNDGNDKIEVKSTNGAKREHTFAIEQLNPNPGAKLLIASMFVVQTGVGKTIFDLVDEISTSITDVDVLFKLREQVTQTIGSNIDEVAKMYFDEVASLDSLNFYDYSSIPSISLSSIPDYVSGVHFRSDLSNIAPVEFIAQDSVLFKSL